MKGMEEGIKEKREEVKDAVSKMKESFSQYFDVFLEVTEIADEKELDELLKEKEEMEKLLKEMASGIEELKAEVQLKKGVKLRIMAVESYANILKILEDHGRDVAEFKEKLENIKANISTVQKRLRGEKKGSVENTASILVKTEEELKNFKEALLKFAKKERD
jgi:hypothetical protein